MTAGAYDIVFGLSDAWRVAFPNSVNPGSVALLARNQLLLKAVQAVRSQMERIMYAAIDIGYYGELPVDEHCHIVEAIVKREPARARQLMYDHIFGSRAKVIEIAGGGAHGQWETS
ncbi:MAG: FCD domain-containing protein [Acidobacteriota bacterium]